MTEQEINKIIAEFMGLDVVRILDEYVDFPCFKDGQRHNQAKFTRSLDALVPVWEKFDTWEDVNIRWCNNEWQCDFNGNYTASDSIQLAAATATAKAIKEMK